MENNASNNVSLSEQELVHRDQIHSAHDAAVKADVVLEDRLQLVPHLFFCRNAFVGADLMPLHLQVFVVPDAEHKIPILEDPPHLVKVSLGHVIHHVSRDHGAIEILSVIQGRLQQLRGSGARNVEYRLTPRRKRLVCVAFILVCKNDVNVGQMQDANGRFQPKM